MKKNDINQILFAFIFMFSCSVFAVIPNDQASDFSTQIAFAKNQSLPMSKRWDALIQAAEAADGRQIQEVLTFTESKDWFMRNALLVALDKMGTDLVYDHAKKLVSDKALVVRSAAVEILSRLQNQEIRKLLSQELNKKHNFVGKKSLWIRSQIMKDLIKNPYQSEREYFSKLLFDTDPEIANMSILALEKISQIQFQGKDSLNQWQRFVKEKKWL